MGKNKDKLEGIGRIGRVEREERVKKNVRIATTVVLVLIAAVLVYGIVTEFIIFPNQAIATVDGEVLLVKHFQTRVKFERRQLVNTFTSWYNYYYDAVQSGDDFTISYAQNEMENIQSQLDVNSLGLAILNSMVEEIIIRHEAEDLGIIVTDEEVEEKIQSLFGYFPNGVPTQVVFPTTAPTSTLTADQLMIATVVPTAITEDAEVVDDDSQTKVEEVATDVAESNPTAVPTEFTYDAYQEIVDGFLESVDGINFGLDDLVSYVSEIIYRERVQEALTADIPRSEEQVWARHILVDSEIEALALYDRIMDGGDFAELAAEYSIDTSTGPRGGDLSWFGRNEMVTEFTSVAFDTPIGEISEPVESSFGFHLIQVVGHEVRPLNPTAYQNIQYFEFSNWLVEKVEEYEIIIEDYWIDRIPSEPALPATINPEQ